MPLNLYRTILDLPSTEKDHPLWSIADSDELKDLCLLQIRSELRDDVGILTDAQCRSSLAKIQAYLQTMDFRDIVKSTLINSEAVEAVEDQEY